ncbi:hypothetical protein NQ317_006635 [Molorchus minor]|uniref:Uncharacterized protein n=1 Tax=Molorchus minor TaxID=1323400 RepID=A0ABQ9IVD4_9CUCU|nr:hypothetical protein NQ317_006635 [Molorchus minor]
MKYIKPLDYQYAAELLIKVFLQHEDQLSDIQLHMLGTRGQLLKVSKKYKTAQGFHDTIAELIPKLISIDEFPQITIDANTIRGS